MSLQSYKLSQAEDERGVMIEKELLAFHQNSVDRKTSGFAGCGVQKSQQWLDATSDRLDATNEAYQARAEMALNAVAAMDEEVYTLSVLSGLVDSLLELWEVPHTHAPHIPLRHDIGRHDMIYFPRNVNVTKQDPRGLGTK